jgi:hypothetical protein
MSWVRTISGALAAFFLTAGAGLGAQAQDGGSPGALVYSIGSVDVAMNFELGFRRTATPDGAKAADNAGRMVCRCVGFFSPRPKDLDYQGREAGRVFVRYLPPGQYEIHDFGFSGTLIVAGVEWSSASPLSIPFTIKPGEATYIGNFARAPSLGTRLEPDLGAVGYFVVSDQSERDLPIARVKAADLPPVRIEVYDVSTLGHPMFYPAIQD